MTWDLQRFVDAQRDVIDGALRELRAGRKTGHWIWFVFPQVAGLGHSELSRYYAINSWDYLEARLGVHLSRQFLLNYTGRYVIPESKFLENSVSIEYRHQCWGVTFSYQNRQNATEFMVSFSLAGIGSLGKMRAY